jgi:O-antigen ligase
MNRSFDIRLATILAWLFAFILVLLPFHEFLTTWIGANYGHLDLWRIWKEIIIIVSFPFALYLTIRRSDLRRWLLHDRLVRAIFIYAVINVIVGLWAVKTHKVNTSALGDGLIIDLRFPLFLLLVAVACSYSELLKKNWRSILLAPAALVVIFGIVQLFLPYNFLQHFGYGPKTIPAYETVNQKIQYHRIQSTLRGANPLGAYLVLVIPALAIIKTKARLARILFLAASLVALFFTYSRSAWVGLILSLVALGYLIWINPKRRKLFAAVCILIAIIAALLVIALRNNPTAEDVFFHTNKNSSNSSSNAVRTNAEEVGFKDMIKHPLGGGVGSAGPASAHNNHPAKIAENYFIQVGQETGLEGLSVFIAINIIVGVRLWRKRQDKLAVLLLVSLFGITFINMLSHAWADDTLSLLWWGLAGIVLTPGIINKTKLKKLKYEKPKKKPETAKV